MYTLPQSSSGGGLDLQGFLGAWFVPLAPNWFPNYVKYRKILNLISFFMIFFFLPEGNGCLIIWKTCTPGLSFICTRSESHLLCSVCLTVGLLLQHRSVRLHKARATRVLCGFLGHQKQWEVCQICQEPDVCNYLWGLLHSSQQGWWHAATGTNTFSLLVLTRQQGEESTTAVLVIVFETVQVGLMLVWDTVGKIQYSQ